jgi:RHS repeat-associated protein
MGVRRPDVRANYQSPELGRVAHVRARTIFPGRTWGLPAGGMAFYFGARFYDPNQPRFMTADWADKPEAVPYSDLADPQSLNLYTYVRNNPVSRTDPDGHCWFHFFGCGKPSQPAAKTGETSAQSTTFLKRAEKGLDTFNATLGFGKTNCANGGSCANALGMAGTAVVAAVVSGGESESDFVETQISTAGKRIENLIGNLTNETLEAASREVNGGMKILKSTGEAFDHVGKVQDVVNGLSRQIAHLERVLERPDVSESQAGVIRGLIERAGSMLATARQAISPAN